jgi:hypothetical protein
MRALAGTLIGGSPRLLGWADECISPQTFVVPVSAKHRPLLEHIVGSPFYLSLNKGVHPADIPDPVKPAFSKLNSKLRQLGQLPLNKLSEWPITQLDIDHHTQEKRYGPPSIDWPYRFKSIHNCPFLLPKYSQLIYWIITGTVKSGFWLSRSHIPGVTGRCPCCLTRTEPANPLNLDTESMIATTQHMFSDCLMVKAVWADADQLGHTFWSSYTAFNYKKDVTLLVHEYSPVALYKLAVLWSLWRYWCELFYQPDNFTPERLSLMVREVMLMIRDEMISRLT